MLCVFLLACVPSSQPASQPSLSVVPEAPKGTRGRSPFSYLRTSVFFCDFIRGAHQDRNPKSTDKRAPLAPTSQSTPTSINVDGNGYRKPAESGIYFSESRRPLPINNKCGEVGWWVGKSKHTQERPWLYPEPRSLNEGGRLPHDQGERR